MYRRPEAAGIAHASSAIARRNRQSLSVKADANDDIFLSTAAATAARGCLDAAAWNHHGIEGCG